MSQRKESIRKSLSNSKNSIAQKIAEQLENFDESELKLLQAIIDGRFKTGKNGLETLMVREMSRLLGSIQALTRRMNRITSELSEGKEKRTELKKLERLLK